MKILKRYKGEDEWFPITEKQARFFLAQDYNDVDMILEEIVRGFTVSTAFALYKKGEG